MHLSREYRGRGKLELLCDVSTLRDSKCDFPILSRVSESHFLVFYSSGNRSLVYVERSPCGGQTWLDFKPPMRPAALTRCSIDAVGSSKPPGMLDLNRSQRQNEMIHSAQASFREGAVCLHGFAF